MATSVETEYGILQLTLVSVTAITYITGLMIHMFIVGVSIIDRLKGRPLTTTDLLITSIGTSRIIFEFVSVFDLFWRTFYKESSMAYNTAINVIGYSATDCNIWLSVLLSVFYSLKISNFQNVFFLYLKKIISQRVVGLIIAFVLLSIAFSSGGVYATVVNAPKNVTQEANHHPIQFIVYTAFYVWNVLPCLLYAISSFALLGSLCHHMQRMKRDQNARSHLHAYFKTIKFIIVSFFCFALYVGINIFGLYYDFLGFAVFFLVWNCFPVMHSIYLIYLTARLRNHFLKVLHGMTKCLRRGSESREVLEIQIVSQ
ncbi:hypothetical protein GDO78_022469 [Eleutherodactylus coqui]|uniref:Taste receptor type 2 n=1 Tax=Eleutherodactylus coqui TaxID=57060 RepID=A0A8J6EGB6_ELECQ|nr:hypothetical protein GDO78_022469 [Eleutherodactylus coqui]